MSVCNLVFVELVLSNKKLLRKNFSWPDSSLLLVAGRRFSTSGITQANDAKARLVEAAAHSRARDMLRSLDQIDKTAAVLLTANCVNDEHHLSAGTAAITFV